LPRQAVHGSWASPLSARQLATASAAIGSARAFGGRLLWTETRPEEGGRIALLETDAAGRAVELLPPQFSVRTRVHEYGAIAYLVTGRNLLVVNDADQKLHAVEPGRPPAPLTPSGLRYADGDAGADGRCAVFVREDHRGGGEPVNTLVAIDPAQASEGRLLFSGTDFVAAPRLSGDGRLAFLSWNHPSMPWDGTRLHVGRFDGDQLTDVDVIAGADDESVIEPAWDDDGRLYFLSDRSGWWNLYRHDGGGVEAVTRIEAEMGAPLWQLGQSTWALLGMGRAIASVCRRARQELALIDLESGAMTPLPLPFVAFGSVGRLDSRTAFAIASAEDEAPQLIAIDIDSGRYSVVRRTADALPLPSAFISRAEPIEFPTTAGADGAPRSAFGFFYPPCNPDHAAPAGAKPPLLVELHGGPTGCRSPAFSLSRQFWTTRGFAAVDVNYGGSSGFGRAYRERLRGQWGVVDLADAVAAVQYLVAQGRVDPRRVVIRGGSAGGFTVLSALAFTDTFTVGVNYYGVADLERIAADTHKFESRYLDSLVAPLPEGREIYRARSPVHHLQQMNAALITFQGAEDRAVPPEQSRAIVEAVRRRGLPVAYLEFEGEQHGFRRAENIARALEAEVYFLGRILGFTPSDPVEPVAIDNLPPA